MISLNRFGAFLSVKAETSWPPMSEISSPTYAVILAGGSGTRFWPLSRNDRPKQLLPLFGEKTLLEQTIDRLDGLIPPERILILTNRLQEAAVREIAVGIPAENIYAEPAKRDTAPAVALGIGLVAARDPEAVMAVLPSDQLIRDAGEFRAVLSDAIAVADKEEAIVTLGIRPTSASSAFGYIERGPRATIPGLKVDHTPYEVVRFREKPSSDLAEQFLAQGHFSWNAGMFIWSLQTIVEQLAVHAPDLARFVSELRKSSDPLATMKVQFPKLTPISIDYALMEKAERVLNIEATFDWDDVGSWTSIAKYLEDLGDNTRAKGAVTKIDSENNIVFNARDGSRVALLGVDDLIIVQTDDALLVANIHQADSIKKLVRELPKDLL
jgi:mannose-1-phosphate guanylyltransferase